MEILIPVSFGELIDKITILEIKLKEIENPSENLKYELDSLNQILIGLDTSKANTEFYKIYKYQLYKVNAILWSLEDLVRTDTGIIDIVGHYDVTIGHSIRFYNRMRSEIKSKLNRCFSSLIKEEKVYYGFQSQP